MLRTLISLLIGLAIGLGIGLYLGWVQFPVVYTESPASLLDQRFKDEYTVMIAAGYLADRDLQGAVGRLRVLDLDNIPDYVQRLTERFISESRDFRNIQYLVALSVGLGRDAGALYDPFREVTLP
ncbi:MAG: hypothetical protein MUF87_08065 [Anaerolineae bacterium]|jgi:hypothetical protein|nr:hypothetical protein [Anaerolineae bacterium]